MKIIIMAGGGGTRLWPLSREACPKQFSKILGDKTMYEQTVARFSGTFAPEDIYVCLSESLLELAKALPVKILDSNYIIEPARRDTAPAMGLVAAYLFEKFSDEPIAFVPADHFIGNKSEFLKIILKADEIIRKTGKMVDIAIQPTFPSTVLGYTKLGKKIESTDGMELYEFLGHKEKPNFETAKQYLESGEYLWHASYYMWTPRKILEAFGRYSSQNYQHLKIIIEGLKTREETTVEREFMAMEKTSFDYAVTEKIDPKDVLIFKGTFGWSDVGAFDVLYEAQKAGTDAEDNQIRGKVVALDTAGCYICGEKDKLIATLGLSDMVIIDTKDALLICPRGKAQEIRKVVEKIKEKGEEKFL